MHTFVTILKKIPKSDITCALQASMIQGVGDIDHEPVPHIRLSQAVHGRVDITHLYELDIRNDIMLGTEVKHLLCLLYPSNLTPSHHFPSCNKTPKTLTLLVRHAKHSTTGYNEGVLPRTRGKIGSSSGFSGKPKVTSFPFTLSKLNNGNRECCADTVSNTKSIVPIASFIF